MVIFNGEKEMERFLSGEIRAASHIFDGKIGIEFAHCIFLRRNIRSVQG